MNQLAHALKPVVLPGEPMRVLILREGKEPNQSVAYLDDGTMVVVDGGRRLINKSVDIQVTSVHQATAGKMIFGRLDDRPDQSASMPRQTAAASICRAEWKTARVCRSRPVSNAVAVRSSPSLMPTSLRSFYKCLDSESPSRVCNEALHGNPRLFLVKAPHAKHFPRSAIRLTRWLEVHSKVCGPNVFRVRAGRA